MLHPILDFEVSTRSAGLRVEFIETWKSTLNPAEKV
jgi:hypothetical protein